MVAKIKRNRKPKKKKTLKPFVFYIIFIIIFFALAAFFISTNWKIYQRRAELNNKITELEKELEDLEIKNKDFKENINYIQSQDYLEQAAREELDMKKPGEEVVVIQREEKEKEEEPESKNWWEKLKGIFMRD